MEKRIQCKPKQLTPCRKYGEKYAPFGTVSYEWSKNGFVQNRPLFFNRGGARTALWRTGRCFSIEEERLITLWSKEVPSESIQTPRLIPHSVEIAF